MDRQAAGQAPRPFFVAVLGSPSARGARRTPRGPSPARVLGFVTGPPPFFWGRGPAPSRLASGPALPPPLGAAPSLPFYAGGGQARAGWAVRRGGSFPRSSFVPCSPAHSVGSARLSLRARFPPAFASGGLRSAAPVTLLHAGRCALRALLGARGLPCCLPIHPPFAPLLPPFRRAPEGRP